jgi:hypothetical protein
MRGSVRRGRIAPRTATARLAAGMRHLSPWRLLQQLVGRRSRRKFTPCSADHDRRNGRREGDEDARRPSSPRDPHGAQAHARIQVRAHGSGRVRRSDAGVCTGRDWSVTLQSYVHGRDRHAHDANARHISSQYGLRDGQPCDRNWVRECANDHYALDWLEVS